MRRYQRLLYSERTHLAFRLSNYEFRRLTLTLTHTHVVFQAKRRNGAFTNFICVKFEKFLKDSLMMMMMLEVNTAL
jgi:hypothetical protein